MTPQPTHSQHSGTLGAAWRQRTAAANVIHTETCSFERCPDTNTTSIRERFSVRKAKMIALRVRAARQLLMLGCEMRSRENFESEIASFLTVFGCLYA